MFEQRRGAPFVQVELRRPFIEIDDKKAVRFLFGTMFSERRHRRDVLAAVVHAAARVGRDAHAADRHRDEPEEGGIAAPVLAVNAARTAIVVCVKTQRAVVEGA